MGSDNHLPEAGQVQLLSGFYLKLSSEDADEIDKICDLFSLNEC